VNKVYVVVFVIIFLKVYCLKSLSPLSKVSDAGFRFLELVLNLFIIDDDSLFVFFFLMIFYSLLSVLLGSGSHCHCFYSISISLRISAVTFNSAIESKQVSGRVNEIEAVGIFKVKSHLTRISFASRPEFCIEHFACYLVFRVLQLQITDAVYELSIVHFTSSLQTGLESVSYLDLSKLFDSLKLRFKFNTIILQRVLIEEIRILAEVVRVFGLLTKNG
jgi:hypothetical protein